MTIYEKAIASLPASEIDHHETDLYIKVGPVSRELVKGYEYRGNVETFRSNIDAGALWYDIPFAYLPEWERRAAIWRKKN